MDLTYRGTQADTDAHADAHTHARTPPIHFSLDVESNRGAQNYWRKSKVEEVPDVDEVEARIAYLVEIGIPEVRDGPPLVQHSTFNVQRSTFNVRCSIFDVQRSFARRTRAAFTAVYP